jgi:hypothetical protein
MLNVDMTRQHYSQTGLGDEHDDRNSGREGEREGEGGGEGEREREGMREREVIVQVVRTVQKRTMVAIQPCWTLLLI